MEEYCMERIEILEKLSINQIVFDNQISGLEFFKNNISLISNNYVHVSGEYREYCITEKGRIMYKKLINDNNIKRAIR